MSGLQKNKLTTDDIEGMIQMRKEGVTLKRIGYKYRVDHSTVIYHLNKVKKLGRVIAVQRYWRKVDIGLPPLIPKDDKTYKDHLIDSRGKRRDVLAEAILRMKST